MQLLFNLDEATISGKPQPTTSIIDKILSTKKNNIQRLAPADIEFCKKVQSDFDKVQADLDIWEMVLRSKMNERFTGYITEHTRYDGCKRITISSNLEKMDNQFSDKFFQPADAINEVGDNRTELFTDYYQTIIRYFSNTYDLSLSIKEDNPAVKEAKKKRTYAPLIDWIFTQIPTGNLQDMALHNLMTSFREKVIGSAKIEAVKNRLLFDRLRPWGHGRCSAYEDGVKALFGGFSYFETGEVGQLLTGEVRLDTYLTTDTYKINGTKIDAIKFFQNGKGIIYFVDANALQEFVEFFSINLS